ncbi:MULTISPECIES: replicative DNA helicase [Carboxydothermus]|uniref:Replicative DNA helicase n=2 Tax=Carboxydothermus TaxID=129957 RepID=Q3AG21_CARHZ|nr:MULTISPECIES: replicative DNA helicase [Carboxydothermus]ABB14250.1 replicative DNA helicase [Carboxydothermus hydrogenoformans Z-2901]NYE57560.1 replicative DNA helicase [Carboxydothermus ferrireducens DSM 11255]
MNELLMLPPHNIDAEQAVLGTILSNGESLYKVIEILKPEDFYRESHKLLYQVMLELNEKGEPITILTVTEALKQKGDLERAGGVSYIASLLAMAVPEATLESHAEIIEEKAVLRHLIDLSEKIKRLSYTEKDAESILEEAERLVLEVGMKRNQQSYTAVREIVYDAIERIEFLYQNRGNITGIPTHFYDLDRMLNGLQKSDLIIVAARPAMGKTSFCLNVAQNAAIKSGVPVAVFSLEMSKEQLVTRMLTSEAMVDQHRVRAGELSDEDWLRLTEVAGILAKAPIYIDDTPGLTIRELRARARRLKQEKNIGLIIIDYLQLLNGSRRAESRQQEISEISRALKGLAKELDLPVVALSQLSRAVEARQDKRPIMSDLRESGSLEQDADIVMFIYREEYYKPDTEKKSIAEIIIAKQRNGPTGIVELGFLKEFTKFVNLAKKYTE